MEKREFISKKQKKIIITLGTVIAVYVGMKYLLPLVVPFLFAYFFAWLLRPVVGFLYRKFRIPLSIGGTIGVVVLLAAVSTIIFFLGRVICNQVVLFLKNIPSYEQFLSQQLEGICSRCDMMFGLKDGSIRIMVDHGLQSMIEYVQIDLLPKITQKTILVAFSLAGLVAIILIILIATVLFIKDMEEYKAGLKKSEFYPAVHKITQKLSDTGIAYMKTQMIIMTIIGGVNALGFFFLKNPYALLIGIIVGVFDAFPVLGSGLILVPWSIIMLLQKKFTAAAIIITIFAVCQIIREILEPKLLGNKIGIRPIYNMIAMYVGLQLFGVTGFFLGPLSLVIIRTVLNETTNETTNEKNQEGKS